LKLQRPQRCQCASPRRFDRTYEELKLGMVRRSCVVFIVLIVPMRN